MDLLWVDKVSFLEFPPKEVTYSYYPIDPPSEPQERSNTVVYHLDPLLGASPNSDWCEAMIREDVGGSISTSQIVAGKDVGVILRVNQICISQSSSEGYGECEVSDERNIAVRGKHIDRRDRFHICLDTSRVDGE